MRSLSLFPPQASTLAAQTDLIFAALLGLSVVVIGVVVLLLVGFALRYRRASHAPRGALPTWLQSEFEIGWTAAAFFLFLFFAWWTGATELSALTPPRAASEIHIVAKQWMWKAEHANGAREINALHVAMRTPVRLVMTSQDVIHSFFVPAFRIKQDVLPGRYTSTWFNATQTGTFHLFCTQLCGTEHARMVGEVVVMTPANFARWLVAQPHSDDLAAEGASLFRSLGCSGCHEGTMTAPRLEGRYGERIALANGGEATLDDAFIREIVAHPRENAVAGYAPSMPSYEGLVGDDELMRLSAYIRSLHAPPGDPQ